VEWRVGFYCSDIFELVGGTGGVGLVVTGGGLILDNEKVKNYRVIQQGRENTKLFLQT